MRGCQVLVSCFAATSRSVRQAPGQRASRLLVVKIITDISGVKSILDIFFGWAYDERKETETGA